MSAKLSLAVLAVVALSLAIACGGGDASSVKGCPVDLTAIAADPQRGAGMPTYTLADAQERVGWLRLPVDPPEGSSSGARVKALPGCDDSAVWVTFGYRTEDYVLSIMEFPSTSQPVKLATPVTIDGSSGQFQSGNGYEILTWTNDGLVFEATAKLGGILTHERFLEILESIPE